MWLLSNLIQTLKYDQSLNGLLNERIYPIRLPQDVAFPAICVNHISDVSHDYNQQGPTNFIQTILQLDIYGKTLESVVQAAEYINLVMDGFKGSWETSIIGGVFTVDQRSDYEETTSIFRISQDYEIWHEEVLSA